MRFYLEVLLGLLLLVMVLGMLLIPRANVSIGPVPCGFVRVGGYGERPNATLQRCRELALQPNSRHPLDALHACCEAAKR